MECSGALLCVDVTPAVVEEASSKGCNLIISHHPLIFRGLKRLTGSTPQEVAIMNAVSLGISIYSSHTAIDNAPAGVSAHMAAMLGATVHRALVPMSANLLKLTVYVPVSHAESVRMALFDAGAGSLGHYDCCSFNTAGTGTFRADSEAHPFVGEANELHRENEQAIHVIVPQHLRTQVEDVVREVHPYECPALDWLLLLNMADDCGTGVYAILDNALTPQQLVQRVKTIFGSPTARCTDYTAAMDDDTKIRRIAICGGSGAQFIPQAIAAGAQAYITSDIKYHDFLDNAHRIFLIDIGHFEAEKCTKDLFYNLITQKFPNFAVIKSTTAQNPILYL